MCKTISVSLAVIFAVCCVLASASMGLEERKMQRYCSTNLNMILSELCRGRGFNGMMDKRSSCKYILLGLLQLMPNFSSARSSLEPRPT